MDAVIKNDVSNDSIFMVNFSFLTICLSEFHLIFFYHSNRIVYFVNKEEAGRITMTFFVESSS